MHVQELLRYADHTKNLLYTTLTEHHDVFYRPFETLSKYPSIRLLVAHIAGAEERTVIQRIGHGSIDGRFEDRAPESIDAVFDEWERIRAHTRAMISALDTAGLAGMVPISLPQWGFESKKTVEQLLFHVFNHQTYHLGQISMTLQRFGIDTINFDYMLMPDERE